MRALIGVELLRKLPAGSCDVRDTKLPGFVLRVRPSGTHTYFANYGRGKWQRLGTTAALTPPEARARARQTLGDVMKGADPVAAKRASQAVVTFDAFINDHYQPWALAQQKSGAEQVAQLRRCGFGALALQEITAFQVERWRSARLKKVTPQTVNRDLNTLRGALARAVDWGFLSVHPLSRLKACCVDRTGVVRYLSKEEEGRLFAALAARDETRRHQRSSANAWRQDRGYPRWPEYGPYTDHLKPLITLALHTGLRRGELFGLTWADVDLIVGRLTVRGRLTKTRQTRHVPLNRIAVSTLQAWRPSNAASHALVFPGRDEGQALNDIKTAWSALLKQANITGFRFHDCRHHFASSLVMRGVDLNVVRELLGHQDIKMVLRYAHLAPEHLAAAVARLVAS